MEKCNYCKSPMGFEDLKKEWEDVLEDLGEIERQFAEEEELLLRNDDLFYDGNSIESLKGDDVIKLKHRYEEQGDTDYLGFK